MYICNRREEKGRDGSPTSGWFDIKFTNINRRVLRLIGGKNDEKNKRVGTRYWKTDDRICVG